MYGFKSNLKKDEKNPENTQIKCLVPAWPTLCEAFLAVDWPSLCGLERNFTVLTTFCADGFMHLAGASVVATPISHTFHSYPTSILRKPLEASQVSTHEAARLFNKVFIGLASSCRVITRAIYLGVHGAAWVGVRVCVWLWGAEGAQKTEVTFTYSYLTGCIAI